MAMKVVRSVEVLTDFRLRLAFSDGLSGVVVVDPRGRGPMFEPLCDPAFFRRVRVSRAAGTIVWPNGLDLAPEVLYDEARASHADRPA